MILKRLLLEEYRVYSVECCDAAHGWQITSGGGARLFHAKARQELPPLFRPERSPQRIATGASQILNNQLQTAQLKKALKVKYFNVAKKHSKLGSKKKGTFGRAHR